jgi:Ca-activated chloride channel family protein
VYAGSSGLVLPSTPAGNRQAILDALNRLEAGGSTNGGEGIRLAYDVARQNFLQEGINRVILATDGDFNVGTTDRGALVSLIEERAKSGVFLSVLGFGMGNLKDNTLEELSNKGNGNYAYIDDAVEARKVFVQQVSGTLVTIAKDVKIQVEFNPREVAAYRLIGYENRILAAQDFNDDTKDAGEIGAGHSVTALYEIVPPGVSVPDAGEAGASESAEPSSETVVGSVDPLKYQAAPELTDAASSGEVLTLKLRYKKPDGDTSRLLEFPVRDAGLSLDDATEDFKFAAAVAEFGLLLRDSAYKGKATFEDAVALGSLGLGRDPFGHRAEFLDLVELAESLQPQQPQP